jgi:L-ascorbate metabolism protein UlaG (beta-lactamase superfamily)
MSLPSRFSLPLPLPGSWPPVTRLLRWPLVLPALLLALSACAASGRKGEAATAPARYSMELSAPAGQQADAGGSVQFIGTATVIIRQAGLTVLTDPNFLHKGDKVHLGYGLTSTRLTDPAIELSALPPIDVIVLSHFHEDHFDLLVQKGLDRNIPIVTTVDAAGKLRELGFNRVFAMDTWDAMQLNKGQARLRITSMPGRHGPLMAAKMLPPVMGAVLDFSSTASRDTSYRIYVSGDTMVYGDIEEIPRRFPGVDLALLHLGGTRVLGMVKVTMDGADGVRMLQIIAPEHAIPIHYNDYDVFKSPLSDFEKAVSEAGLAEKVTYLKHGESFGFALKKR